MASRMRAARGHPKPSNLASALRFDNSSIGEYPEIELRIDVTFRTTDDILVICFNQHDRGSDARVSHDAPPLRQDRSGRGVAHHAGSLVEGHGADRRRELERAAG